MPKMRARILATWQGSGTEADPYRPVVPWAVASVTDVTGQPSVNLICTPNSVTVEVVCTDAVLATIPAGVVLWSEEVAEMEVPLV
jgi:hypothetical protein